MERALFDWEEWDELETMVFQLSGVTLKVPIAGFPAGHRFSYACLNYDKGEVEFYDEEDRVVGGAGLRLVVVD